MTATQILATLSADPWVHARVWQYDMEQTVGVVARSYAAAVFREGSHPPNEGEAAGELRYTQDVDGGHSAEWWAVQLLREIGRLLCTEHPEGIWATEDRWIHFGERWTRLVEEIDAWEAHHRAIRPAVADGTHRFGTGYAGHPPSAEWEERKRQAFAAEAAWVDAGGLDHYRLAARRWALRADRGLGVYGPVAEWLSCSAFREEAGTTIVPRRLPRLSDADEIRRCKAEREAHQAAAREAMGAEEAAWGQWQAAVDAAFPGIPWHGQTAYRGGVGPH